jgi:hypothetical protein
VQGVSHTEVLNSSTGSRVYSEVIFHARLRSNDACEEMADVS